MVLCNEIEGSFARKYGHQTLWHFLSLFHADLSSTKVMDNWKGFYSEVALQVLLKFHCILFLCLSCLFFIWTMGTLVHLVACTCSWVYVIYPPATPLDQYTAVTTFFCLLQKSIKEHSNFHNTCQCTLICVTMNSLHYTVSTLQMVLYTGYMPITLWLITCRFMFQPKQVIIRPPDIYALAFNKLSMTMQHEGLKSLKNCYYW